jgi:hypothetical protein
MGHGSSMDGILLNGRVLYCTVLYARRVLPRVYEILISATVQFM